MPVIIPASTLRTPAGINGVSNSCPGWYRWWAPKEALRQLLGTHFNDLFPHLTQGENQLAGLYYIYVGVAIRESIRARLNWHVNQRHTLSCVRSGTLSTLRQSIASLVGQNQLDENATNALIDQLMIEYFTATDPIKSLRAKAHLVQAEAQELVTHALPLNIKSNHNKHTQRFKQTLKAARSAAKQNALA